MVAVEARLRRRQPQTLARICAALFRPLPLLVVKAATQPCLIELGVYESKDEERNENNDERADAAKGKRLIGDVPNHREEGYRREEEAGEGGKERDSCNELRANQTPRCDASRLAVTADVLQ